MRREVEARPAGQDLGKALGQDLGQDDIVAEFGRLARLAPRKWPASLKV